MSKEKKKRIEVIFIIIIIDFRHPENRKKEMKQYIFSMSTFSVF